MIRCGITGSSGSIGSIVVKTISIFSFIKFNGDITNKKDVEYWIKNNNFDFILILCEIYEQIFVNFKVGNQ